MNKKYQVFVSSTYNDLREERLAVISGLLDISCIPVGMEQFPASPSSQWEYIKKMIDMSDYYILIVAGKYGSIDPEDNISYTEKEYNYAKSKNIPILAFLYEDIDNLPAKNTDNDRVQIDRFRKEVSTGRLIKYYSNVEELRSRITSAMYQVIDSTPRPGWIRADEIETISSVQDITKKLENFQNDILKKIDEATPKLEPISKAEIRAIFDDDTPLISDLSNEAKKLLINASKDPYGQIFISTTFDGTQIYTNGNKMNETNNGKCIAIWEDAIRELVNNGLAKLTNSSNCEFRLTRQGYELAEKYSSLA